MPNEDPIRRILERIVREIRVGITNKTLNENLFIIMDRRAAIAEALELAMPGDIVVITGKGAEETNGNRQSTHSLEMIRSN